MIYPLLSILVFMSFPFKALADVVELSGIYKVKFENGIIVPNTEDDLCEPPYVMMEGSDMCIEPFMATNTLGLILYNDSTLDFAFNLTFFNGHSCSMRGVGQKTDAGWQYRETLPEDFGECVLDITIDDQDIVLNSPEEADCRRFYCGARGHLHDIRFPILSKTDQAVSQHTLDCMGIVSDECKKAIQQQ